MKHHKRVVVVMFENRSFDNLCGFIDIPKANNVIGKNIFNSVPLEAQTLYKLPEKLPLVKGKETMLMCDPGEEYEDVKMQMGNLDVKTSTFPMDGFVANYYNVLTRGEKMNAKNKLKQSSKFPVGTALRGIMTCVNPDRLSVFAMLAKSYVLCDNWFCSLPSQTYPNRCFFHAGTSGGQVDNRPFRHWIQMRDKTLFDQLEEKKISWKIYFDEHDVISLTWLIHNRSLSPKPSHFHHLRQLFADFEKGTLPTYSFIEPRFLVAPQDFHPKDADNVVPYHNSVLAGDRFLGEIYEAWRTSPIRDETLLLVSWDEAGGLLDSVSPPPTVPPLPVLSSLSTKGKDKDNKVDPRFAFLGVRVPTIFISSHQRTSPLCSIQLDHTSFLRSMHEWFGLLPLTQRDASSTPIPESTLFRSRIRAKKDLPIIISKEMLSWETSLEKGMSVPLCGGLSSTFLHQVFCLLEECKEHKIKLEDKEVEDLLRQPAHKVLDFFEQMKKELQWFPHLVHYREVDKQKKHEKEELKKRNRCC